MPEGPEVRIMSDFINRVSHDKNYTNFYHVSKGNNAVIGNLSNFRISSKSNGKELILKLDKFPMYVFMGMSGNWKYVPTSEWDQTKYVRFRVDDDSGNSLILCGGYLGPKYSIGSPFSGVKRGPDPIDRFEDFKKNILDSLHLKIFDGLFCDVILDQRFFNGIGNYLRSTLVYYANVNPFLPFRDVISDGVFSLFKEVLMTSYQFGGGQIKDWKNPFDMTSVNFKDWVFYKKGLSCVDKSGRTFWFDPKWEKFCPYKIKK